MRINSSRSKVSAIWIHRLGHSSIHLRHNEKKTGEITEQIHRIGAEGAFIRRVSVNTSPRQLNAAAAERTSVIVAVFDTLRPAATDFWWSLWPAPFDRYMCNGSQVWKRPTGMLLGWNDCGGWKKRTAVSWWIRHLCSPLRPLVIRVQGWKTF